MSELHKPDLENTVVSEFVESLDERIKAESFELNGTNVRYVTVYQTGSFKTFVGIDNEVYEEVYNRLTADETATQLILDLSGMPTIDSNYLRPIDMPTIFDLYQNITDQEGTLKLVIPEDKSLMRKQFQIYGLLNDVDIYATRQEALDSYK